MFLFLAKLEIHDDEKLGLCLWSRFLFLFMPSVHWSASRCRTQILPFFERCACDLLASRRQWEIVMKSAVATGSVSNWSSPRWKLEYGKKKHDKKNHKKFWLCDICFFSCLGEDLLCFVALCSFFHQHVSRHLFWRTLWQPI